MLYRRPILSSAINQKFVTDVIVTYAPFSYTACISCKLHFTVDKNRLAIMLRVYA